MNFLLETSAGNNATQWILPVVLLVLVVGIFILNYFRSKKNQETMQNMVENLKVGDNVKTYSGLYGKIIEIVETTDGKVAILETGSEKNKGIFSIDINAIYGIDEKKPVVYDADGNIIEPKDENEGKTEKSDVKVEQAQEVKEETEKPKTKKKSASNSSNKDKEKNDDLKVEEVAKEPVEEKVEENKQSEKKQSATKKKESK